MEYVHKSIRYESRTDTVRLYLLSCTHLGSRHTKERELRRLVIQIRDDPAAWWIHLGDVCEWIGRRDKRHDEEEMAHWLWGHQDIAKAQRDYAAEMFGCIGPKLLAMCEGNHEAAIYQHEDTEVYKELAGRLTPDKVCLGHRGLLNLAFRRGDAGATWVMRLFLSHGSGGGQSDGAVPNRVMRIARAVEGVDVVAVGHYHNEWYRRVIRERPTARGMVRAPVHYLAIPSWLDGAEYGERRDYEPQVTGYGVLTVTPDKRQVSAKIEVV